MEAEPDSSPPVAMRSACPSSSVDPDAEHADDGEILLDLLPTGRRLCTNCKLGVPRCVQVFERPPPYRQSRRVAA
jgi:hypothetical protein